MLGCLILLAAISTSGFDYPTLDTLPRGTWIETKPYPDLRNGLFTNASIISVLKDFEGVHLRVLYDKPQPPCSGWRTWIDSIGRPWLWKQIDEREGYYWQSTDWRDWRFADDKSWELYWNHSGSPPKTPPTVNYGVSLPTNKTSGTSFGAKTSVEQPPCPGPGPCPRPNPNPSPRPNNPDDWFPIKPSFNVNVDPTWIAVAILGVGFAGITMFGLVVLLIMKRRAA